MSTTAARFQELPLADLTPNAYNARRFEENMTPQRRARFEELVESISGKGILEPLLVRPIGDNKYEVIAGERRYRAALQVELATVPCMVREVNDDDAFDIMVIENLQREDLTPVETAQAFQVYLQRHGNTTEAVAELASRTGIPGHAIRRQVRLLDLPAEILAAWRDGKITQSHVELFTRLADHKQALEIFTDCVRLKLTTRELAQRIGTSSPELNTGFFDKSECHVCSFNTEVQSGLFADATPGGRCGNAPCFEAKQGEFLTANWPESKAAKAFSTRGYRFSHRLPQEQREPIMMVGRETCERCLACDEFVTLVRLTGAVVGGYDRTCVGPRACFEELYMKPEQPAEEPETEPEPTVETPQTPAEEVPPAGEKKEETKQTPAAAPPAPAPETKKTSPAKQTKVEEKVSPVFSAFRGERQREDFFKQALPDKIKEMVPQSPQTQGVILLALALSSASAKIEIIKLLGLPDNIKTDDLAASIFARRCSGQDKIEDIVQQAAIIHLMLHTTPPSVRRIVAEQHGILVEKEWRLNKEYLQGMTKSDIVAIGEETGIWKDEQAEAYRQKHFKGKALMALKNEDLIKIILESGADLSGRVPAEVVGKKG